MRIDAMEFLFIAFYNSIFVASFSVLKQGKSSYLL